MAKPWDESAEHRAREIPAGSGKKIRYVYEQWSEDGQRWERVNKGDVPKKEQEKLEKAAKRAEGKGDGPLRAPRKTSKTQPPPWWTTEESDDETPNPEPETDRNWVGRNRRSKGNNTPWRISGDYSWIADKIQQLADDNTHLALYKLRFTITRKVDGKSVSYALQGQDPGAVFSDWLTTFNIGPGEILSLEWAQFEDYSGDEVKPTESEDDDVPF